VWNKPRLRRTTRLQQSGHPDASVSADYVFTRADLGAVIHAIRDSLDCGAVALDSPHRLQDALRTLIGDLGGRGDVTVRRSPAALLTPEYWRVDFTGLDPRTDATLRSLFAGARR